MRTGSVKDGGRRDHVWRITHSFDGERYYMAECDSVLSGISLSESLLEFKLKTFSCQKCIKASLANHRRAVKALEALGVTP